jgi:hypothetical protein
VSEQTIDDVDMAVLSGPAKGVVYISNDKHLARVEHLLHNRQSTIGSVITECLKIERHLRSSRLADEETFAVL